MRISLKPIALRSACIAGLILPYVDASGVELRDPATRDDDISATEISATVTQLNSGIYEYLYNVTSPPENRGVILTLSMDISCELDFGTIVYPEPPYPHSFGNASEDGNHIPVQVYPSIAEDGTILSAQPGISIDNEAFWLLGLRPDDSIIGLKIYSPAPPEMKTYTLSVDMDATDISKEGFGWDYSDINEDSDIPWIEDFEVSGIIRGPGCKLPEDNPDNEPPRFDGSNFPESPVNHLLSYTEPTRDKFHVSDDQGTVDLVIHYHEDIDPKSFRAEPAWAKRLFNPEPGTFERVTLRLDKKRNRFKFEASTVKGDDKRKDDDSHHSYKDMDVFEIRKPPKNDNQGKGKK